MIYDIAITAEQAQKLGEWIAANAIADPDYAAPIELKRTLLDGYLIARQGDEYMAWNDDGELPSDDWTLEDGRAFYVSEWGLDAR